MNYNAREYIDVLKKAIMIHASETYLALMNAKDCSGFEKELISSAMLKLLEKDRNDHEQHMELLAISFMLRGIKENLRLEFGSAVESEQDNSPF